MTLEINIIIFFITIYFLNYFYFLNIDYFGQIIKNSKIPDYTRWILSDKYVSKLYAEKFGFKISKTYQIEKYPQKINFSGNNFVIKPLDLCDSAGVYLIKNRKNIKTGEEIDKNKIINNLLKLRSSIFNEFYMHEYMYNGLVPFTGYIKEELLLNENGDIPSDYKCYVFGGKLYYVAVTFNRFLKDGVQHFNSVWFDREWVPSKFKMIKKGYLYKTLPKPKCFDKLVNLVENMGKKLKRHCRIDVYIVKNEIYFGEYTFFCGASLHSIYGNLKLGLIWLNNKDDYKFQDNLLKNLVPEYYNIP